MKRKERRHLKENELVETLATVREYLEPRRKAISLASFVVFIFAIALVGVVLVRQRTQARAADMLAQAMVVLNAQVVAPAAEAGTTAPPAAATQPAGTYSSEEAKLRAAAPKLKAVADSYPDSKAGITARYHLAGTLAILGRHQEAAQAFDDVQKRDPAGLYGRMARLGKADEQARTGQYDAAIATYKALADKKEPDMPLDAILMELGRTYLAAGKKAEAQKVFTQIVDEHPDSPYTSEARKQLDLLKG
jgi:tetratricopeptide (TPR) repeat protein